MTGIQQGEGRLTQAELKSGDWLYLWYDDHGDPVLVFQLDDGTLDAVCWRQERGAATGFVSWPIFRAEPQKEVLLSLVHKSELPGRSFGRSEGTTQVDSETEYEQSFERIALEVARFRTGDEQHATVTDRDKEFARRIIWELVLPNGLASPEWNAYWTDKQT